MSNPVIKIQVSSDYVHAGKSLVIRLLSRALSEEGFSSIISDDDLQNCTRLEIEQGEDLQTHIDAVKLKNPVFVIEQETSLDK